MTVNNEENKDLAFEVVKDCSKAGEIDNSNPWRFYKTQLKLRFEENYQYFLNIKHNITDTNSDFYLNPALKQKCLEMKDEILKKIDGFKGRPFTFQRICELLTTPDLHHPTLPRYLRALIKLTSVLTYDENDISSRFVENDEVAISIVDVQRSTLDNGTSLLQNGATPTTSPRVRESLQRLNEMQKSYNNNLHKFMKTDEDDFEIGFTIDDFEYGIKELPLLGDNGDFEAEMRVDELDIQEIEANRFLRISRSSSVDGGNESVNELLKEEMANELADILGNKDNEYTESKDQEIKEKESNNYNEDEKAIKRESEQNQETKNIK